MTLYTFKIQTFSSLTRFYLSLDSYPIEKLFLYWGAGYPTCIYLDDPTNPNYDVQIYSAFPNVFNDEAQPDWNRLRIEETFNGFRGTNMN